MSNPDGSQKNIQVEVKCVSCRHKMWVGPTGELGPECPKCYSPMVATGKAEMR